MRQVEDEEDPRAELVKRLQEYEVIKQAADDIEQLPRLERDLQLASVKLADNFVRHIPQAEVTLLELQKALQDVLQRSKAFEHHHIQVVWSCLLTIKKADQ